MKYGCSNLGVNADITNISETFSELLVAWAGVAILNEMHILQAFRKHLLNFREQFYKVSSASNFGVRVDKAQTSRNQMNTEHSCEASLRRCGRSPALLPRRR